MTALLSSMFGVLVGLVLGAAIQRWGDGTLATEHHTKPLRHDDADLLLPPSAYTEKVLTDMGLMPKPLLHQETVRLKSGYYRYG